MSKEKNLWTPKPGGLVGKPVRRFEDARLLRGEGRYIADLCIKGMTHMAVVRSIYPHARILDIETRDAMELPGDCSQICCAPLAAPSRTSIKDVSGS